MTFELNPGQQRAWDNLFTTASRFCLLYGGSRSGKTFLTVYTIVTRALKAAKSKHLIVRQEGSSARAAIMRGNMATLPVVIALCFPGLTFETNEKFGYITLPNGSEIWIGGLNDDKAMERILGNEYATIYINEASEVRYSAFTLLRSRLAQVVKDVNGDPLSQRFYVDLNPTTRNHWTYRVWIDGVDPETESKIDLNQFGYEVINPYDNLANLSGDYIADLEALPDRARKRFLSGEYVEDVENALWRRSMIRRVQELPDLQRVVIAVDPAVTSEAGSDNTGIIAAGLAGQLGYVLDDDTGKYRPEEWARRAIALYDEWDADRIVAEANQGGDMVEAVIRAQRPDVPVTLVRASRGKYTRAEPVAALYERGKVFHAGRFEGLEDEMCFPAGTLIDTLTGPTPIEAVSQGDLVLTRSGYFPVKVARQTGVSSVFAVISSESERTIECTLNHPIYTRRGFVSAANVRNGDRLLESPNWAGMAGLSHGVADGSTGKHRGTTATRKGNRFIAQYGKRIAAQYLRATTFITRMATLETTGWRIWNAFRRASIGDSMALAGGMSGQNFVQPLSKSGMRGSGACGMTPNAIIAGRATKPRIPIGQGIAAKSAGSKQGDLPSSPRGNANTAGQVTSRETHGGSIAVRHVTTRHTMPVAVYNLEVDGPHEYFANGFLVHNCSFTTDFDRKAQGWSPDRVDALVWAFTDLFPHMTRRQTASAPIRRELGTMA